MIVEKLVIKNQALRYKIREWLLTCSEYCSISIDFLKTPSLKV